MKGAQRLKLHTKDRQERLLDNLYRDFGRRIEASPPGLCPVDMTLSFLRTCHSQSCGKCVPCRVGLGALTKLLESVMEGSAEEDVIPLIEKTALNIRDTSDCAIGSTAAETVLSAIRTFRDDFLSHILSGRCNYGLELTVPCSTTCPCHVDVPGYIALTGVGRYDDAVRLIRKDNPFPSVCAYICEHPCEERCRRHMVDAAINICGLKRYAVDHAGEQEAPPCAEHTGKRVCVVGAGPGGLTAAYYLTLMGHSVTVYEQREKPGGMLRYGIPVYRLPRQVLEKDIRHILSTGIELKTNINVGEDISIDELKENYDAVYLAIGAHVDRKLDIEGEEGHGVHSAIGILRMIGEGDIPDLEGKRVCVVGGGNVAMDAARTSLRLGAKEVFCIYDKRMEDLAALPDERDQALKEGMKLMTLVMADHVELDEDSRVKALWVHPQIVSGYDKKGKVIVRNAYTDLVRIECDYVFTAIGQSIQSGHFLEEGKVTVKGTIETDASCFVPGSGNVFAGGDAVTGATSVVLAVHAGKTAADNIDAFLGGYHEIGDDIEIPSPRLSNVPPCARVDLKGRRVEEIKGDFDLVNIGMSPEEAIQEASRCLRCDRFGYGLFRGGRKLSW